MTREELRLRKADLRRRIRAVRDATSPDERTRRGALVRDRVLALPRVAEARTVMAFSSFGSEVPTHDLVDALRHRGQRVLLPYLDGPRMHAAELRAGQSSISAARGPAQPPDRMPTHSSEIDVVIVPGLAFDRAGHRVGYGGGHYDRFLAGLDDRAFRVAVGFDEQVVDRVPHGPDDEPVDLVVTDRQTIVTHARVTASPDQPQGSGR